MRLRPEVRRFAEEMERQLQAHDGTRGDEWTRMHLSRLIKRLNDELAEFREAYRHARRRGAGLTTEDWRALRHEAADLANISMFLVEVIGRRTHLTPKQRA